MNNTLLFCLSKIKSELENVYDVVSDLEVESQGYVYMDTDADELTSAKSEKEYIMQKLERILESLETLTSSE